MWQDGEKVSKFLYDIILVKFLLLSSIKCPHLYDLNAVRHWQFSEPGFVLERDEFILEEYALSYLTIAVEKGSFDKDISAVAYF